MAEKTQLTIKGLDSVKRNIQRFGDFAINAIGKVLYVEGETVMSKSKRLVPVNYGILRSSGRVEPPVYGSKSVSVNLGYGGAASGYALYIHEGIGPAVGKPQFMPPVAPFAAWAKRKLGDESLGFVIARSVGSKGLKPRKYLERPFLERSKNFTRDFSGKVDKELRVFNAAR